MDQRGCKDTPGNLHKASYYKVKEDVVAVQLPSEVYAVEHESDTEETHAVEDGDKSDMLVPEKNRAVGVCCYRETLAFSFTSAFHCKRTLRSNRCVFHSWCRDRAKVSQVLSKHS